MQRRLARVFLAWILGSLLLGMVCVTYIYALPSPVSIASLEEVTPPQISVASKPSRLAFIAFGEESTVRAFWKDSNDASLSFTIEIDPASMDAGNASEDVPGEDALTHAGNPDEGNAAASDEVDSEEDVNQS
ncbi:MAG: hypothetical protein H7A35_12840 [Planctomycetales bacterium]|nr:hypothetical protein [bacterium]UNM07733.1 MAG: hypothetical protein H7A35_12840 [Planctomycetales bacterium]